MPASTKPKKPAKKPRAKAKAKPQKKKSTRRKRPTRKPSGDPREDAFAYIVERLQKDDDGKPRETMVRRWRDLERVRVVSSPLTSYNRASQCGGVPLAGIVLVTGPWGGGKTQLAYICGVMGFDAAGHMSAFLNTEQKQDRQWMECVADSATLTYPAAHFYGNPPNYERMTAESMRLIGAYKEGRATGRIDESIAFSLTIDSLDQANPSDRLLSFFAGEEIDKEEIKKFRDIDRHKAWLNVKFVAALVQAIEEDPVVVFLVTHEKKVIKKYGGREFTNYAPKGGEELENRARQTIRCWYQNYGGLIKEGSEKNRNHEVGKWHRFKVIKSNSGFPLAEGRFPFTRGVNGYRLVEEGAGNPYGLDVAREMLYEAEFQGKAAIVKGAVTCPVLALDNVEMRKALACLRLDKAAAAALRAALST